MIRTLVAAALALSAGSLQLPQAARAADQALPVPEIEKIVRDYLMREPEVIYEAIQELQKRQQAAEAARQQTSIVERADEIFRHPEDPIAGDPSGDVTLVEFFDYHCGYCRRMVGDLRTLVDADAKLRFVFKELPVLGPDSVDGGQGGPGGIEARPRQVLRLPPRPDADQGPQPRHRAQDRWSPRATTRDAMAAEMEAAWVQERLDANHALAESLGINGTPSFVVGKTLIPGAVEIGRLAQLVQDERKASN